MNSFERFKDKNNRRKNAVDSFNTQFVLNGYPTTKISCGENEVMAAVINQQEKDKAYIYTDLKDSLDVGSVWTTKDLHLLVVEEITIIKDVKWRKYVALLCNVEIDDYWGYFKGPQKSAVGFSLSYDDTVAVSNMKPLLITSARLGFKDKLILNNRAWTVTEWDDISTAGIIYYSLAPTTATKEEIASEKVINEVQLPIAQNIVVEDTQLRGSHIVSANTEVTISTEDGYFKTSEKVDIIKRKANEVIFSIPYGVTSVIITTKKEGDEVETTYNINE